MVVKVENIMDPRRIAISLEGISRVKSVETHTTKGGWLEYT